MTDTHRGRNVAVLLLLLVAGIGGGLALTYQPLVAGSVRGADQHLLIGTRSAEADDGSTVSIYEYRFHAYTSYYTLVSLRNQGPLAVMVLGIDIGAVLPPNASIRPAELLNASSADDPSSEVPVASARRLEAAVVEPNAELLVWIRWEIGACDPAGTPPGPNIGWAHSSIPVRWSVMGVPRTSEIELGYTVSFETTPAIPADICVREAAEGGG